MVGEPTLWGKGGGRRPGSGRGCLKILFSPAFSASFAENHPYYSSCFFGSWVWVSVLIFCMSGLLLRLCLGPSFSGAVYPAPLKRPNVRATKSLCFVRDTEARRHLAFHQTLESGSNKKNTSTKTSSPKSFDWRFNDVWRHNARALSKKRSFQQLLCEALWAD